MTSLRRALAPACSLAFGLGLAVFFLETGPQAFPEVPDPPARSVEVVRAEPTTFTPVIRAMGVVQAERSVSLAPEVSGRVKEQNRALVAGGRVAEGEPLIRVDPRDYADALTATEAEVAQAQLRVREESTLRQVAEHEWRDRPQGFSDETLEFALRGPHAAAAQAQVRSARTRLAKAQRDLGRTLLRAPFDAVVLRTSVDLGQTVGPATAVVTLAGTDRFRVAVSLPVSQLQHLRIPGVNIEDRSGSDARVYNEAAGSGEPFDGSILRLESAVDTHGRMATLHVAVDDPLSLAKPASERPLPLLIGTYVRVELQGRPLDDVVALPRRALDPTGRVWVLDEQSAVHPRAVAVAWREPGIVVIREGLQANDMVVVTPLPLATDGMLVAPK